MDRRTLTEQQIQRMIAASFDQDGAKFLERLQAKVTFEFHPPYICPKCGSGIKTISTDHYGSLECGCFDGGW
jgi:hypothetical protein